MTDFRNAPDAAAFADQLLDLGIMLPLRACPEFVGSVVDDEGDQVFVVDPDNERSDEESAAIAALVVGAVNAAGGFES
jgi:hypothetical protein